jgi:hypothetical protein
MSPVKINSSLLVILLLLTQTTLWTRISVQGLELPLLSSALEWNGVIVDSQVRGVGRFRVADASVMPHLNLKGARDSKV